MNYRERVINTVRFKPVDSLPFRHAYGLLPGVLESWYAEGLPSGVKTIEDQYAYFGFPKKGTPLPVNIAFDPPFETRVIEETDKYAVSVDWMNRRVKVLKQYASIPLPSEFPVRDMATWQDYRTRLKFHYGRIGSNLEKVVEESVANGCLNSFGIMGFYWFPRDLMGDEALCVAYYEMPDLVNDILETYCSLIEKTLTAVLERVRLDAVHLGEDMAYKNASMVSKSIFDSFISPYYLRLKRLVERFEIPVFSVDTDGCLQELASWFRDVGVNLIGSNEVQAGNDVCAYRRQFGSTLAYDGGLDKRTLTCGREAIDAMLESTIPFMKETGGGWIIALDHRVVQGTPLAGFRYYIQRVRELSAF